MWLAVYAWCATVTCLSARSRPVLARCRCQRHGYHGCGAARGCASVRGAMLPPYLRRTKMLEELLPWLYLKGLSTGESEAS